MRKSEVSGDLIKDGSIQRKDLDVTSTGQAVITKIIAGTNIVISSTGADPGTGDVTISSTGSGVGSSILPNNTFIQWRDALGINDLNTIGVDSSDNLILNAGKETSKIKIQVAGATKWEVTSAGNIQPETNGAVSLGWLSKRIGTVYSNNLNLAYLGSLSTRNAGNTDSRVVLSTGAEDSTALSAGPEGQTSIILQNNRIILVTGGSGRWEIDESGNLNILGFASSIGASQPIASLTSRKVTLTVPPTDPTDAATKAYVDDVVSGFSVSSLVGKTELENTALGVDSLINNTTGIYNVAVGQQCLTENTTGYCNVAIGHRSLQNSVGGSGNIAIGFESLKSTTIGGNNIAIGTVALANNTTGFSNTAVGDSALVSNTTGSHCTALGAQALRANTTGAGNIAVGSWSLYKNTTGWTNIAIGPGAMYENESGIFNLAIGNQALGKSISTSVNVAVGHNSLQENLDGYYNVALGTYALRFNTTGINNTAVGILSGDTNTTGSSNTSLGFQSLQNNTTGSQNTALGSDTLKQNTTGNRNIAIGCNSGSGLTAGDYNVIIGSNDGTSISGTARNIIISDGEGNIRIQTNESGNTNIIGSLTVNGAAIAPASGSGADSATNSFATPLSVVGGRLDIPCSGAKYILGTLTDSVTEWNFTGVDPTAFGSVIEKVLVLECTSSTTFGSMHLADGWGSMIQIIWAGGSAPTAHDGLNVLRFTRIIDGSGVARVFGRKD